MKAKAVNLIARPTRLFFDLKTGRLDLFRAVLCESLFDAMSQITHGGFELRDLAHLIEQALFKVANHKTDLIIQLAV
jgi:hypothetical protein